MCVFKNRCQWKNKRNPSWKLLGTATYIKWCKNWSVKPVSQQSVGAWNETNFHKFCGRRRHFGKRCLGTRKCRLACLYLIMFHKLLKEITCMITFFSGFWSWILGRCWSTLPNSFGSFLLLLRSHFTTNPTGVALSHMLSPKIFPGLSPFLYFLIWKF